MRSVAERVENLGHLRVEVGGPHEADELVLVALAKEVRQLQALEEQLKQRIEELVGSFRVVRPEGASQDAHRLLTSVDQRATGVLGAFRTGPSKQDVLWAM